MSGIVVLLLVLLFLLLVLLLGTNILLNISINSQPISKILVSLERASDGKTFCTKIFWV